MSSYLLFRVLHRPEASMKRSNPTVQNDLFSSVPAPPALASLELHHDELVELLSQLLWQVASNPDPIPLQESSDEQDQP
jgi:hypothetical protein